MRRSIRALLVACAVAPLTLVALPAHAATTFTQNAFSVSVSGSTASLVSNIGASPTTAVNDAKFCTRDSGGTLVDYTAPVGTTISSTGTTLRRTTVALSAGDYTSVPCVRVATTGSYTEVGARKPFTVAGSTPSPSPTPTPTPTPSPTPSDTPTPSPSPTATTPPPPAGTKPGASNTGVPAGTTLTAYTGPHTITTPNTVIDGKDISGGLVINATGVVVKNSKIHGDSSEGSFGIQADGSGGAVIQDTEIYNFGVGITYGNFTATRVNLHDLSFDGIKLSSNATVQDSWIHNAIPTADAHWDGIQVQNGVVNTVISGNNIDVTGSDTNDTMFLCPDLGPTTAGPLTVTGNWLNGGNFTVNILDGNNGQYFIRDIRVTNNKFGGTHTYGYANVNVPITQSGNTDANGNPLSI